MPSPTRFPLRSTGFSSALLTEGEAIQPTHRVADLLRLTVAGTLLNQKWALTQETALRLIGIRELPNRRQQGQKSWFPPIQRARTTSSNSLRSAFYRSTEISAISADR